MPKTPTRGNPGDDLPVGVRDAVTATLEPDERIERHVPVVGAHLILTGRRLFVVRHGYDYRPATGSGAGPSTGTCCSGSSPATSRSRPAGPASSCSSRATGRGDPIARGRGATRQRPALAASPEQAA